MNYKVFFSLMLCVFFPLIASDKTTSAQQQRISDMQAIICVNDEDSKIGLVTDIKKKSKRLALSDALESKSTCQIWAQGITLSKNKNSIEIIGMDNSDTEYRINFADDSFGNLKKELEKANVSNGGFYPVFQIHLMYSGNPFTLVIEESQFQEQIMGRWSLDSKIMTGFTVVGLLALICYFDLYSKGMALLGRG
jgi:hypothetical protein